MSGDSTFETFLISKKIDSAAFKMAEPEVWMAWKHEFEQSHANSFTMQKLNLINPIRRKYQLQVSTIDKEAAPVTGTPAAQPGKPMMKPRPKMN